MGIIKSVRFEKIVRPLRTTFSTSLGRKDVIKSIILDICLNDGSRGLGECPTSFVLRNESIETIEKIIREVAPQLKNRPIEMYNEILDEFRKFYPRNPMTISGIEVALFRAYLAHRGEAEFVYFGGKSSSLETDITIPFTTDMAVLERWLQYVSKKGFTIYKLKVSGNAATDKKLITEVYRLLRDHTEGFTIRLDGNQGFTENECLTFLDFLGGHNYPVELFEQPLKKDDYEGLKEIRKCSPVPIILDETVFNEADLHRAVEEGLCHGINIKIAKSGISETLKLYDRAKKHGLSLMMGCMMETMVGLSIAINLAAGMGGFDYIDLDSIHFLWHRNIYESIKIEGSKYRLSV